MKQNTYLCEKCYRFVKVGERDKKVCSHCNTHLKKVNKDISLTKLKKRVWKEFATYIRKKKCLETTGTLTKGVCYTCKKTFAYKDLQAGHLVPGRTDNVLFAEDCVELQCYACNVCNHGKQADFIFHKIKDLQKTGLSLEQSYKKVKALFHKRKKNYTKEQLVKLLKKYNNLRKELEKNDRSYTN